jgi:hypothetical protein
LPAAAKRSCPTAPPRRTPRDRRHPRAHPTPRPWLPRDAATATRKRMRQAPLRPRHPHLRTSRKPAAHPHRAPDPHLTRANTKTTPRSRTPIATTSTALQNRRIAASPAQPAIARTLADRPPGSNAASRRTCAIRDTSRYRRPRSATLPWTLRSIKAKCNLLVSLWTTCDCLRARHHQTAGSPA